MLELFTYDFMQRSLLAAALVGALCSTIGVFVVLRGLAFMGAGTAHAAFAGLSIVVIGAIVLFSKELYFIAFDQEMAEASGVPARRIFFLLLTLVALTVVISLKTVGAILVFAMILIPASTAYQLTHSLSTLTWYSVLIGITCSVGGVLISSYWDVPSGPAIVLLATLLFFVAVLFSPKKQRRSLALG